MTALRQSLRFRFPVRRHRAAIPMATPTPAICRASTRRPTMGLVTDVCLKRKIRNYAEFAKGGEAGYDIYVQEGAILNEQASARPTTRPRRATKGGKGQEAQPEERRRGARVSTSSCATISSTFAPSARS